MTDKQYYSKKWLERSKNLNAEIKILEDNLEVVRQRVNNIVGRYELNETQHLPGKNNREELMCEVADMERLIERRLRQLMLEDIKTANAIDKLQASTMRSLLQARYCNRYSWKKIERLFTYSHSQMMRLHGEALEELYEFIPKGGLIEDDNQIN